jgi:hypothetical protein
MKVIICSSRTFENYEFLKEQCLKILIEKQYQLVFPKKNVEIVLGNAKGVDLLGERLAKEEGFQVKIFLADWKNMNPKCPDNWESQDFLVRLGNNGMGDYNKQAGYIRNQEMANYIFREDSIIIAFDNEQGTTGTKDMIKRGKKLGVEIYHIKCYNKENVKIKIWNKR